MLRRLGAPLAVALLFTTGCRAARQTPAVQAPKKQAEAQTFRVEIGGKSEGFNGDFTTFFPTKLTAHAGDSVKFEMPHFTGEPHTVTLGTLVDAGVAKIEKLGGPQPKFAEEAESELLALTDVFPHATPPGPPEPNQSAAQPCYLDTGEPPHSLTGGAPPCATRTQPEFTGKQTFYNSGALFKDGASFDVKLSKDIAPGTYSLICLVHRATMFGKLVVVPKEQSVPAPDEVGKDGAAELDKRVADLKPAVERVSSATPANGVAGVGVPNVFDALVADFGPKEASVATGGSISWSVFGFHTISLNAGEGDVGVLTEGANGAVGFNPRALAPTNSPGPPPGYFTFPQKATKPLTLDGGRFDGSGFKSSGILASLPPVQITYKVAFTKPGTYELRCLVHPDMKGKVKVG